MTERPPRRRLRIRRKRKSSLAADFGEAFVDEAVTRLGCCLVEAVFTATALVGLLVVPTYFVLS